MGSVERAVSRDGDVIVVVANESPRMPPDIAALARAFRESASQIDPRRGNQNRPRSHATPAPPIRSGKVKVGRNDLCPCGSGKKFKKCCLGDNGSKPTGKSLPVK